MAAVRSALACPLSEMPTRDSRHCAASGQTATASAYEVVHVARLGLTTVAGIEWSRPSASVHSATSDAQNMHTVSPESTKPFPCSSMTVPPTRGPA